MSRAQRAQRRMPPVEVPLRALRARVATFFFACPGPGEHLISFAIPQVQYRVCSVSSRVVYEAMGSPNTLWQSKHICEAPNNGKLRKAVEIQTSILLIG